MNEGGLGFVWGWPQEMVAEGVVFVQRIDRQLGAMGEHELRGS